MESANPIIDMLGNGVAVSLFVSLAALVLSVVQQAVIGNLRSELTQVENAQKARNESRIHINKVQYENEVEVCTKIWGSICDATDKLSFLTALSPQHKFFTTSKNFEQQTEEFFLSILTLRKLHMESAPFLQKDLFDRLQELLDTLFSMETSIQNQQQTLQAETNSDFEHSESLRTDIFITQLDEAVTDCTERRNIIIDLIRLRLKNMTVVE
jgi:hypothetical protein